MIKRICKNCAHSGKTDGIYVYCHNWGTMVVNDETECKEYFGVEDYYGELYDDDTEILP